MQESSRGFTLGRLGLALRRRPDFFLSHSSHDKAFALRLSHALTQVGVDVFLDAWELEVGDSLHRSLSIALEQSRFIGVVISPRFAKSEWCLGELSEALAREKRDGGKVVIPIKKRDARIPFLGDRLYADFSHRFYVGVIQIGQIVHGLDPSRVGTMLLRHPPANLRDTASILERCGWNSTSLIGPKEFQELHELLEQRGIEHVRRDGVISIDLAEIKRLRQEGSRLEAVKTLVGLYLGRSGKRPFALLPSRVSVRNS
jgi:hypothetical protein